MVGTGRCIAHTLCNFGGPMRVPQATASACVPTGDSGFIKHTQVRSCAGCLSAHTIRRFAEKFIAARRLNKSLRLRAVSVCHWDQVRGREVAAFVAAAEQFDPRLSRRECMACPESNTAIPEPHAPQTPSPGGGEPAKFLGT